jgi:hypothetical protein
MEKKMFYIRIHGIDIVERILNKSDIEDGDQFNFDIENLLKSIAISTMRGIIFSDLRGTILHNAILPLVMADSFKPIKGTLLPNFSPPVAID